LRAPSAAPGIDSKACRATSSCCRARARAWRTAACWHATEQNRLPWRSLPFGVSVNGLPQRSQVLGTASTAGRLGSCRSSTLVTLASLLRAAARRSRRRRAAGRRRTKRGVSSGVACCRPRRSACRGCAPVSAFCFVRCAYVAERHTSGTEKPLRSRASQRLSPGGSGGAYFRLESARVLRVLRAGRRGLKALSAGRWRGGCGL
jgi:hypothetical protein